MTSALYRCSQNVFYILSRTGWRLCHKHLAVFSARKPKYTDAFIDAQLAAIDEADYLPDFNGRYVDYDLTKIALAQAKADFLFHYGILLSYIKDSFSPTDLETMYNAAGKELLPDAKNKTSSKMTALMSAAVPFAETYATQLGVTFKDPSVKNMSDDFPSHIKGIQTLYNKLLKDLRFHDENGQEQTTEKVELNNALYLDLIDMLDDGTKFFADDEVLVKEFVYNALKLKAEGTKQAGIQGVVLDETTKKAIKVVAKISIIDTERSCTTNDKGRFYLVPLAADKVKIQVEAEGYDTQIVDKFKIKSGTTSRFTFELTPVAK